MVDLTLELILKTQIDGLKSLLDELTTKSRMSSLYTDEVRPNVKNTVLACPWM